jgi:hypothetical protein
MWFKPRTDKSWPTTVQNPAVEDIKNEFSRSLEYNLARPVWK